MATNAQMEGVAHLFDTLAASAVIGAVVGVSGNSLLSVRDIVLLFAAFPMLLIFSWILRSPS